MEQKHLLSALSAGVGVGVGLGLVSGWTVRKWTGGARCSSAEGISFEQVEEELVRLVVDGKESKVTFEDFPYYISERTRTLLTSSAYVHLKRLDVSKHTRNLCPATPSILLSGPSEIYLQMLAKALAHHFEAKLLLLDIDDFSLKIQSKYCIAKKDLSMKRFFSQATLKRMSSFLGSFSPYNDDRGTSSAVSFSSSPASSKWVTRWLLDENNFLQSLYKVLVSVSQTCCVILYIRDVEWLFLEYSGLHKLFDKMLNRFRGSVLVLGSRMLDDGRDSEKVDDELSLLFPSDIKITPPKDETNLKRWKTQLEEDMRKIHFKENKNYIAEVLAENDIECDDLEAINHADTMILSSHIEDIVVSALSHHLMNNKDPKYRNGKLVISSNSLSHGLSMFKESETASTEDSQYEKRIREEVVPANKIGVTFSDIGALDEIKETLQELVMLPLRRPDLFTGGLINPCRGILLFGPPGTGKTMLAKAIAKEAGASFINVSMSTINSKWSGEDEKNVRALFTLAAKVSPTIIFVDEVDTMLSQRSSNVKNEFVAHWDGILSKPGERILVLAATNRPFDLDEAIVRRFERRIMVDLPSMEGRGMILKAMLSKEKVKDLDFKALAAMTEGYSGSDLKHLCVAAAYRPMRELIQGERQKAKEKKSGGDSSKEASITTKETKHERVISLRPLNMEDMRQAKNQVGASFASQMDMMIELKEWNNLYGEGGSRRKEVLSYFI